MPYNYCYRKGKVNSSSTIRTELVDRILNSGFEYIQSSCFSLCIRRLQTQLCNCSIPTEYEVPNLPSCRQSYFTPCLERVYNEIYLKNFETECVPLCPPNCDSIVLSKSISTATYPSNSEVGKLLARSDYLSRIHQNSSLAEVKETVLYLRIHFSNLQYTYISQIPKVTVTDLTASIGGTIG